MLTARALLVLCALAPTMALGHEDSLIEIRGDGSLKGLPTQYEPVKLVFNTSLFRLRVGRNEITLPSCLTSHLGLGKAKLDAYASWYHERSVLPPYLGFNVIHDGRRGYFFNGFSLLFNLETGSLIEVTRISMEGDAQRRIPVDLRSFCDENERTKMEPRRASG